MTPDGEGARLPLSPRGAGAEGAGGHLCGENRALLGLPGAAPPSAATGPDLHIRASHLGDTCGPGSTGDREEASLRDEAGLLKHKQVALNEIVSGEFTSFPITN